MTNLFEASGRRFVERQMADTCVIGPMVRGSHLDEESGEYDTVLDPVYQGRCKLEVRAVQVRDVDSAGQDLAVADAILSIPVTAAGSALVEKDHVARITVTADGGRTVEAVVQAGHVQTYATARRLPVQITS